MKQHTRLVAKISLKNIEKNLSGMYKALEGEGQRIIAVIKADGYGNGAVPIAEYLDGMDIIAGYAVATVEEAVELREAGIKKPVLILGFTFPEDYEDIVRYDIRPAVFKYDMARALSDEAVRQKKTVYLHIKLDTGMGRIGYRDSAAADEIAEISRLPNVEMEGVFTHFAKADMTDREPTDEQIKRFYDFVRLLKDKGVDFKYRHCANSAGIIRFGGAGGELVRAGITMYGLWPSPEVERDIVPLYPAMSLISHIACIKTVPPGTPISYGGTFVTERSTQVATIPAGYADGVPRSLSNKGEVLIRGKRAPIIGRVCMDQFMVDVSDIEGVSELDEVVLIGEDKGGHISFEDWERLTGLLNYELSCHIGKRVSRLYVD